MPLIIMQTLIRMKVDEKMDDRLEMLKERTQRCVCKYCGKHLSIRRITFSDIDDARIEIFCKSCDRIEFGVEPEIYQSALYFVDEMGFDYYPDLDKNEKTKRMNVAKVCDIMSWENKNLGILDRDGFTVPIDANPNIIAECVILDDNDLEEIDVVEMGNMNCEIRK